MCTGIREGNATLWDAVWSAAKAVPSNSKYRKVLIQALGCSKETWTLKRYGNSFIYNLEFSTIQANNNNMSLTNMEIRDDLIIAEYIFAASPSYCYAKSVYLDKMVFSA